MLFREVFKDDKLVGIFGWDNGVAAALGKNNKYMSILKRYLTTIRVEESDVLDNGTSITKIRLVNPNEEDWIGLLEYDLNTLYKLGPVGEISLEKFDEFIFQD